MYHSAKVLCIGALIVVMSSLVAIQVFATNWSQPTVTDVPNGTFLQNINRPCIHTTGGWTDINCTAGAAYSAVLHTHSRYIMQAVSGDPYIAFASASSGQDADSNDGYLPEGQWYEFITAGAAQYVTCDGSADTSRIRYIECL